MSNTNINLDQYLKETHLCNFKHPIIQNALNEIINDDMTDEEKAIKIFYFIRDSIKYAVFGSGFLTSASRAFKIGYGDCGTKTNIHIAFLRSAKIPARMRGVMADASVLKDFMPKWMYKMATRKNPKDFHFWTECYINNRWIACDSLLDKELYKKSIQKGIIKNDLISTIDWNGKTDLIPLSYWIVEDLGVQPGWDEWNLIYLKKMMPNVPFILIKPFYLAMPILRNSTNRIRNYKNLD